MPDLRRLAIGLAQHEDVLLRQRDGRRRLDLPRPFPEKWRRAQIKLGQGLVDGLIVGLLVAVEFGVEYGRYPPAISSQQSVITRLIQWQTNQGWRWQAQRDGIATTAARKNRAEIFFQRQKLAFVRVQRQAQLEIG